MKRISRSALALSAAAILISAWGPAQARTIHFSGYVWEVRSGPDLGGPGPNYWGDDNVRVDEKGRLHLQIVEHDGRWSCSEVTMLGRLGFGTYQFQVTGRIDRFDPNIVLGLFNYPTPDVGPDGTHEIDIEYSRWGRPANPIGNYTVWPTVAGPQKTRPFPVKLNGDFTVQQFTWKSKGMEFQSSEGKGVPPYAQWIYKPGDFAARISQSPMPIHINLWLFQGKPPKDGKPVEIIIQAFKYTPA